MSRPVQCVYRAYAADGSLLYIGTTKDFDARRKQHLKAAVWIGQVAKWRVRWYLSWQLAEAAEAEAIRTEHPRWNVSHRSPDHPDGYVETFRDLLELHTVRALQEDVVSSLRLVRSVA